MTTAEIRQSDRLEPGFDRLCAGLEGLAGEHGVPGISLAICSHGRWLNGQAGVAAWPDGAPVAAETAFQIGSISKLFTALSILRLAVEGALSLSDPVGRFLPELDVLSSDNPDTLRIRHLLTHTCGLEGDLFPEMDLEDGLEQFLCLVLNIPVLLPPGRVFSYCNTGYNLLGLIVERLTGVSWEELVTNQFLQPLELGTARILGGHDGSEKLAFGHNRGVSAEPELARPQFFPKALAPSGASLVMSAPDLARFGCELLSGLRDARGGSVFGADTTASLFSRQVSVPGKWVAGSWGLGGAISKWGGYRVLGHAGATIGQYAWLDIFPALDLVIALLTNGGDAVSFRKAVYEELLMPEYRKLPITVTSPVPAADPGIWVGDYGSATRLIRVRRAPEGLNLNNAPQTENRWSDPPQDLLLQPFGDGLFETALPGSTLPVYVFFRDRIADIGPCVHLGGRAYPKLERTAAGRA